MPDFLIVPFVLAKTSAAALVPLVFAKTDATISGATSFSSPQNVIGGSLQPCAHDIGPTGYNRNDMCHAPGDPNHHEVCVNINDDFWPESGQGPVGIHGKWCICVHKLGDWLRGTSDHGGITGIDCAATSSNALHGDPEAAKYILSHCPPAVSNSNVGPWAAAASLLGGWYNTINTEFHETSQRCPPKEISDFL